MGALAGAGSLPARGVAQGNIARAEALKVASANAPGSSLSLSNFVVTFKCVVSDPEGNGGQDSLELTFVCGPAVAGTWTTGWAVKRGKAIPRLQPERG